MRARTHAHTHTHMEQPDRHLKQRKRQNVKFYQIMAGQPSYTGHENWTSREQH